MLVRGDLVASTDHRTDTRMVVSMYSVLCRLTSVQATAEAVQAWVRRARGLRTLLPLNGGPLN